MDCCCNDAALPSDMFICPDTITVESAATCKLPSIRNVPSCSFGMTSQCVTVSTSCSCAIQYTLHFMHQKAYDSPYSSDISLCGFHMFDSLKTAQKPIYSGSKIISRPWMWNSSDSTWEFFAEEVHQLLCQWDACGHFVTPSTPLL